MTGTIYLIVESETDFWIVQTILQRKNIPVRVDPRYARRKGQSGISRLAVDLESLIKSTLSNRGKHDCIVVLYDADRQNPAGRDEKSHQQVEDICKKYAKDVFCVQAVDEIEAWLLADSGICDWLQGAKARSKNCDNEALPSREMERLMRKKNDRFKWPRDIDKVLSHIAGDGDVHSPSLERAIAHLDNTPCTQK